MNMDMFLWGVVLGFIGGMVIIGAFYRTVVIRSIEANITGSNNSVNMSNSTVSGDMVGGDLYQTGQAVEPCQYCGGRNV